MNRTHARLLLPTRCRLLLASLVVLAVGCNSFPRLYGPGTSRVQQLNASVHDPYADSDAGPEVVGSRPRDFQKPWAEPVRSRLLRESWWGR